MLLCNIVPFSLTIPVCVFFHHPPSQDPVLYHICVPQPRPRTGLCAYLQRKWIKNSSHIWSLLNFWSDKDSFWWSNLNSETALITENLISLTAQVIHTFTWMAANHYNHGENWKIFPILVAFLLNPTGIQYLYTALWPSKWKVHRGWDPTKRQALH